MVLSLCNHKVSFLNPSTNQTFFIFLVIMLTLAFLSYFLFFHSICPLFYHFPVPTVGVHSAGHKEIRVEFRARGQWHPHVDFHALMPANKMKTFHCGELGRSLICFRFFSQFCNWLWIRFLRGSIFRLSIYFFPSPLCCSEQSLSYLAKQKLCKNQQSRRWAGNDNIDKGNAPRIFCYMQNVTETQRTNY